ncbi:hypothetical protein jhhlp_005542 [Lomentospora prolificans]|uniref:Uncharacterized protein n=1 Tax=Lomentospora prolificans TaxID=41688 RepID=A0A2N3N3D2_9PEZI|nr:hypothetical protein jhhlp_005542 [Lomentospora prolificans]
MSRAVDKDVLEALSRGDPKKVFAEISQIFDSLEEDGQLLEFEFLGRAHLPPPGIVVLRDGKDVGLSKLHIFQAFGVAYRIFKEAVLEDGNRQQSLSTDDLRRVTAVMLLSDPEHLTAANCRKRTLLRDLREGKDVYTSLRKEKYFVDSILTSRLHRHTKSPTLWSHRRWLLGQFKRHGISVDVATDLRRVVFVSGERHPRNYYAWCHARWLLATFSTETKASVRDMVTDVNGWCLKHHDDISGWSFFHYLLRRTGTTQEDCSAVFSSVIQMTESFKWHNESVWWFLHALATDKLLGQKDLSLLREIGGRMFDCLKVDQGEGRLACKWFRAFEQGNKRLDN